LHVVVPVPMPSGMVAGGIAQKNWDALTGFTAEYRELPQEVVGHADWPVKDAKANWRVLVVSKEALGAMRADSAKRQIVMETERGPIVILVDPATRELVRKRFAELGWELQG
jgi:hypothetical protein